MSADRRAARVLAMQALCQWDVQKDQSAAALEDFLGHAEAEPVASSYARELISGFWNQKEGIDARLSAASPKWDLERMSSVERNVLRVAVVEMLGGAAPPRVALDEAIEIAKEYGGADSPRFVNGVLDHIYRQMTAEAGRTA